MPFTKTASMGFVTNHLARLFGHHLALEVAPLELAPAQFMTLLELWEKDGVTQADLAIQLDVEQATMANTLKRMERDELVTRTPHPKDRRARLIWLTDKARTLETSAKQKAASINKIALSGLSEEDIKSVLRIAGLMIENLQRDRP